MEMSASPSLGHNADVPSPIVSDIQQQQPAPASASAPAPSPLPSPAGSVAGGGGPGSVNGVAFGAAQSVASPAVRSETPAFPSHPSTPTIVNGQPPPPSGAGIAAAAVAAAASAAAAAAAAGTSAAASTPRAKDQLRWRDPMTVKYESGQAHPGKLQASSTQPPPPPLPPTLQHQQQQPQHPAQSQPEPQQQQPPLPQSQPQQAAPPPPSQPQQQQQPPPPHAQQQQQQQHSHQQQQQHAQNHYAQHQQPQPSQPSHQYPQQPHAHVHAHPHQPPHQPHQQQQRQQQHPPPPQYHYHQIATQPQPLPPLHQSQHLPAQQQPPPPPPPARQNITKPVIMDPPASRRASQAATHPQSNGFPSPTQDYARINPKFIDDSTRLTFAVQQSMPESVRRVIRDNWEKCLLGSEFHQAFVLNASIHHALPSITQRAVRDFGRKMVIESKVDLIGHFEGPDIDEVADLIISKASNSFLDKCLEKRLLTIEAKPLISALAKAERLGYEPGDQIQEFPHERVIPQEAYPGAGVAENGPPQARPPVMAPLPAYPPPPPPLQCLRCLRTFQVVDHFEYHTRYNVCMQQPPTKNGFDQICTQCGQGFTSPADLQSHINNKSCGGHAPHNQKQSRGPGRPPRAAPVSQANPVAILPSVTPHAYGPNGHLISYTQSPVAQSTPAHPHAVASRAATTPVAANSPNHGDPYGHLTEEQHQAMNEELQGAEAKYAPRFAEAEQIQDENERRLRIEGLRNSFGTKQSMIRKKYGVRLRERRTKAEIQAERERLGIKRAERERARALGTQHNSSPTATQVESNSNTPVATGWTAANTAKPDNGWEEHDTKRRRIDNSGAYQTPYPPVAEDTPTRKHQSSVYLLGNDTAAAEDPAARSRSTSQPAKVYEQSGARVEIHEPSQPAASTNSDSPASSATPTGTSRHPSTDGLPSEMQPEVIGVDDSDSSDDDDIPPTLPAHIRQSLSASQKVSVT